MNARIIYQDANQDINVRRIYREIMERNIFNLTIEEIEAGERPGWVDRCIFVINGEYATIRLDVQWKVTRLQAIIKVMRMQVDIWIKALDKK